MHKNRVPPVFQDGASPLDVRQVAALLGWTRDAVRAACDRSDIPSGRDHLNRLLIPCTALVATLAKIRG